MTNVPIDPRTQWCIDHVDELHALGDAYIVVDATGILATAATDRELSEKLHMLPAAVRSGAIVTHTRRFVPSAVAAKALHEGHAALDRVFTALRDSGRHVGDLWPASVYDLPITHRAYGLQLRIDCRVTEAQAIELLSVMRRLGLL